MTPPLALEAADWIAIGVALVAIAAAWLLARFLAGRLLAGRERRTGRRVSTELRRDLQGAAAWTAGASVGTLSLPFLPLTGRPLVFADRGLSVIELVGVALLALALIDLATSSIRGRVAGRDERAERLLVPVARKFGRAAVFTLAILFGSGSSGETSRASSRDSGSAGSSSRSRPRTRSRTSSVRSRSSSTCRSRSATGSRSRASRARSRRSTFVRPDQDARRVDRHAPELEPHPCRRRELRPRQFAASASSSRSATPPPSIAPRGF